MIILAIGEVGDKTGGDRPREHCICKKKIYVDNKGKGEKATKKF